MAVPISVQQDHWFRNDDGSLATATYMGAQGSDPSLGTGTGNKFRLRILVEETNAGNFVFNPTLYVDKNGGGYVAVTASSSNVRVVDDDNSIADGSTTDQDLTFTGTFDPGSYDDVDGAATAVTLKNEFTEIEWCLYIVDADVVNGDTLTFKAYDATAPFDVYTDLPVVTVSKGSDANPTPLVISIVASAIAPAVVIDASPSPAALSIVAATQTAIPSPSVEPAVLSIVTSTIAPAINIDAAPSPAVLSVVASAIAPTIVIDANYTASVLSVTASVQTPDVSTGSPVVVEPLVLTAVATIGSPVTLDLVSTVAGTGPLGLTASVITPAVVIDADYAAPVQAITASVVTPQAIVDPAPAVLSVTASIVAPAIVVDANYAAPLQSVVASVLAPTVVIDATFEAAVQGLTASVIAPAVDTGAGPTGHPYYYHLVSRLMQGAA